MVWGFCPDEDDYVIKDREENVETHAVVTREVRGNPAWFLGSEHEYMDSSDAVFLKNKIRRKRIGG